MSGYHSNKLKYLIIANEPYTGSPVILVISYHHIICAHLQQVAFCHPNFAGWEREQPELREGAAKLP